MGTSPVISDCWSLMHYDMKNSRSLDSTHDLWIRKRVYYPNIHNTTAHRSIAYVYKMHFYNHSSREHWVAIYINSCVVFCRLRIIFVVASHRRRARRSANPPQHHCVLLLPRDGHPHSGGLLASRWSSHQQRPAAVSGDRRASWRQRAAHRRFSSPRCWTVRVPCREPSWHRRVGHRTAGCDSGRSSRYVTSSDVVICGNKSIFTATYIHTHPHTHAHSYIYLFLLWEPIPSNSLTQLSSMLYSVVNMADVALGQCVLFMLYDHISVGSRVLSASIPSHISSVGLYSFQRQFKGKPLYYITYNVIQVQRSIR